jgi:tRNA nucleotidyltransferase (CCA-adding enzyme)
MILPMEVYAVGGAVRDALLGISSHETDWVVVGGSPVQLLRLGFRSVGQAFPVFLHPDTGEQYALARTERKTGPGYHGFTFDTSQHVTLEEDLGRRDLTINAMARRADGSIVDPWGGRADIERRLLRHVSDAFREDPLRVLRVARFAARFNELGFRVAPETLALMAEMAESGELSALQAERVWQETQRALCGPRPDVYFSVLRECGALAILFPEVDALFGVPQPPEWHPEIDTGIHTLMAVRAASDLSPEGAVRFAALTHDLGKARTPAEFLPRHPGHEHRSVKMIESMAARLRVPRRYLELARLVAEHHGLAHRSFDLRAQTLFKLLEATDAFRRPDRFEDFLLACEADARGRTGKTRDPYPQADILRDAFQAARQVRVGPESAHLSPAEIGHALREARIAAIQGTRAAPNAQARTPLADQTSR